MAALRTRVLVGVRGLPDHALLDRLVRGRVWIPLLGILLAGIVATQVEVLRLNASMGRALSESTSLSVRNQALRTSVAEFSDDARIERLAAGMGMIIPGPTALSFVGSQADVKRAVQNIHPPSPSQFEAQLPSYASSPESTSSDSSASTPDPTSSDSSASTPEPASSDTSATGGTDTSGDTSTSSADGTGSTTGSPAGG